MKLTARLYKNRQNVLYGISLAILLLLLRWLEYRFLVFRHSLEIYIAAIALLFTGLGVWLARKLTKPRIETIVVEREIVVPAIAADIIPDEKEIEKYQLSTREIEVLQLMAEGLSNQEIADRLFVSLNTIKSHSSRIFEKLDVRRRTQAVEKAKRLVIIR